MSAPAANLTTAAEPQAPAAAPAPNPSATPPAPAAAPAAQTTPQAPAAEPPKPADPAAPPALAAPAAAAKPAEPAKPAEIELKVPDGSTLPKEAVDAVRAYAKGQNLGQGEAQAVLNYHNQQMVDFAARQQAWIKEAEADPEIGGAKLTENSEYARRFVERIDPSGGFAKLLKDSGYGNYLPVLRFLSDAGRMAGNDVLDVSSLQAPKTQKKSPEQVLFGDIKQ